MPTGNSKSIPRVLFDATTLRSMSARRGVGRMLWDLLRGLHATRDHWGSRLQIDILERLYPDGEAMITADIQSFIDRSRANPIEESFVEMKRRLYLDRVATTRGYSLVYLPEVKGTPLTVNVPAVHTCHDLIPLRFPTHYLWPAGLPLGWRWAKEIRRFHQPKRVVAISEVTKRDVVRLLRVPAEKVDVVPNGCDLSFWASASTVSPTLIDHFGVRERPYLFFAGYCDYRKNIEGTFAALKKARRELDLGLVWAGDLSSEQREHVAKLAHNAGVGDAVKVVGFVSDDELRALIANAAALLFLSRIEGFGLPVLEAMAAGCPVIVARDSGCDEVASDAAIVVDPDDHDAAAAAVVTVVRDARKKAEMIERGRIRASLFSAEKCAEGYIKSFERALERV